MGELQDPGALDSTADAMGTPPEVDRMALEHARARVERELFGTNQPACIGRYQIADTIGGGGMGMVYRAYDPQLQRNVALKILHPRRTHEPRAQQRMILEARALAKLDHANVVKVHDVLLEREQVVVVMELLDGETLEHWQSRAPRGWKEVIAVYAQAGDGLAAAHGVGVVHRDFKPSNVIIGRDGRVRVVDFGLARLASSDDVVSHPDTAPAGELTATGDVVGTLAYSSPEQLGGQDVTAASDQFSFCVSLHRAVEGVAPFTGATPSERRASIEKNQIIRATDFRRAPPWLGALIARGLAPDPLARYPGMQDVVRELRRARGWRKWRLPVFVAAGLAVTVTATALLSGGGVDATCAGAAELVEREWNAATRAAVGRAIDGVKTPYAVSVRGPVLDALDHYARSWSETHASVCRAHERGEASALLLDRQMVCLARRLGDLRAAVGVLAEVDAQSLANVMDVTSAIPSASRCGDLEAIQADVAPPDSPTSRVEVTLIRTQISAAEALARAGRSEDALAMLAHAHDQVEATTYVPVKVEAALAEGRILLAQHALTKAKASLERARALAFEEGMQSAGLEAAARVIYIEGQQDPDLERLERELVYVMPQSAALSTDHFTRPLLLNNIGTVYLAAGRREEAYQYFEKAREAIVAHDPRNLELTIVDINLVMLTSDTPKREAIGRRLWEKLDATLGSQHPATLHALGIYALHVADPQRAFEAVTNAAIAYARFHPSEYLTTSILLSKRAVLASELGDRSRAIASYEDAISAMDGHPDEDIALRRRLCAGELALQQARPEIAIEQLLPVYQSRIQSDHWWERVDALRAEVGLGQAEAALGHRERAIQYLDDAVTRYPEVLAVNEEVEPRRFLARAQRALARLLRTQGLNSRRVETLMRSSRAFYQAASPTAYRWLLDGP